MKLTGYGKGEGCVENFGGPSLFVHFMGRGFPYNRALVLFVRSGGNVSLVITASLYNLDLVVMNPDSIHFSFIILFRGDLFLLLNSCHTLYALLC